MADLTQKVKAEKPKEATPEAVDSLRGRLRDAMEQIPQLDTLIQIVADACQATQMVNIEGQECVKCGFKCGHFRKYPVANVKQATEALKFVMEQVEGRPGVAEGAGQQTIVNWIVPGVDE